jgi:hypothetical protein
MQTHKLPSAYDAMGAERGSLGEASFFELLFSRKLFDFGWKAVIS